MDEGASPQSKKNHARRLRKFGFFSGKKDPEVTPEEIYEEEIISIVNEGTEHGAILASEAEMITNIFELGDKEAHDIMIHRKSIAALDSEMTLAEAMDVIVKEHHSRYPVFQDDIDNILGIIIIKDVIRFCRNEEYLDSKLTDIPDLLHEVSFIPETRSIDVLFRQMQKQKKHMVIVIDEYGQTSGLVCMEDILEEIVGNILDEHDDEDAMILQQSDNSYIMDGMAPLDDIFELLNIEDQEEILEDYDTLNGFLISLIDKIPVDGEAYEVDAFGYHYSVLKVENKMIKSVKVTNSLANASSAEEN